MKIRLDENLSYRVANAVMAFTANRAGFEVSWVRQDNPAATHDPAWLSKFAADDGDVVLSGDWNILKHWPDLIAYTESGLVSFFPPYAFKGLKGFGQAALILRWWPAIIEKAKQSKRGDRWRFPMSWTPNIDSMEPLRDPRIETDEKKRERGIEPTGKVYQLRPPA